MQGVPRQPARYWRRRHVGVRLPLLLRGRQDGARAIRLAWTRGWLRGLRHRRVDRLRLPAGLPARDQEPHSPGDRGRHGWPAVAQQEERQGLV